MNFDVHNSDCIKFTIQETVFSISKNNLGVDLGDNERVSVMAVVPKLGKVVTHEIFDTVQSQHFSSLTEIITTILNYKKKKDYTNAIAEKS